MGRGATSTQGDAIGVQHMEKRIEASEEQIAHLIKAVEDLSDVVARQARELEQLSRRVGLLLGREAAREADGGGGVALADQRPPHW